MPSKARKVILRSRFYRIFAILFVGVGAVLFLALFLGRSDDSSPLTEFHLFLILVLPFLPAAFLSWYSTYLEKKYFRLIGRAK